MTILGETVVLDGKKQVDARRVGPIPLSSLSLQTAIVTQTPFIYPGTLRDSMRIARDELTVRHSP
jgi:ABC-type transport system involved in cytochrome bd biosynthesis fused ATPase/permease subunit